MKTFLIGATIFLLALGIRSYKLDFPNDVVFDEETYLGHSQKIIQRIPYFDVHPPLFNLLLADLVKKTDMNNGSGLKSLRKVQAILGSILVVFVFVISMNLYQNRRAAVLVSLMVTFDNALVFYAKYLLPDTLLLTLGFGAWMLFMFYERSQRKIISELNFFTSLVFIGLAVSVKWTALVFMLIAAIELVINKRPIRLVWLVCIPLLIHLLIWTVFYRSLNTGTVSYFLVGSEKVKIDYPNGNNLTENIIYFPKQIRNMIRATVSFKNNVLASSPFNWFIGIGGISHTYRTGIKLAIAPNMIGWWTVTITVILLLFSITRNKWNFRINYLWPMIGFVVSYLPFFFIGRVFFIYSYFIPLVFGYLAVPAGIKYLSLMTGWKKQFLPEIYLLLIILVVLYFMLAFPVTYGISVPNIWRDVVPGLINA